jgi:kynurenine formamidase
VAPRRGAETREEYNPALAADDWVITRQDLAACLDSIDAAWLSALVVRTLPNPLEKRFWQYGEEHTPPFFSLDAASYLVERGVRHLLVDFPSVDRMYDEGKLAVHRRFWHLPEQGHEVSKGAKSLQTITEMIYVPDSVCDGNYLVEIQIPAFLLDAAPSRPWLYPLEDA